MTRDYVPDLAVAILESGDKSLSSRLKGFAVGNPVFDCEDGHGESAYCVQHRYCRYDDGNAYRSRLPTRPSSSVGGPTNKDNLNIQVDLFYYHGLTSLRDYKRWQGLSCSPSAPSQQCVALFNELYKKIGPLDGDNLVCTWTALSTEILCVPLRSRYALSHCYLIVVSCLGQYTVPCTGNASLDAAATVPGCVSVQDRRTAYLNRADVQQALHVTQPIVGGKWTACAGPPLVYETNW